MKGVLIMDVSEIISDALVYPLQNIKALLIYIVLGIIAGIAGIATIVGILTGAAIENAFFTGATGIIGLLIFIVLLLLIDGYGLDIVKYGINRRADGPGIDFARQVSNAIKLIIIGVVYYIVPAIIAWLLTTLLGNGILTLLVVFILYVVFALAEFMAKCRLAKTDDLSSGLAIGEAIGDISRVGIVRLLATIIIIFVILLIVFTIAMFILYYSEIVGGIILGILSVYAIFFANRAIGLLYSDV